MSVAERLLGHDLLGPVLKGGIEEGRQEGIQRGTRQGVANVPRRLMEKRFGPLPSWENTRLTSLTTPELQELLLDVQTLDELLPR